MEVKTCPNGLGLQSGPASTDAKKDDTGGKDHPAWPRVKYSVRKGCQRPVLTPRQGYPTASSSNSGHTLTSITPTQVEAIRQLFSK